MFVLLLMTNVLRYRESFLQFELPIGSLDLWHIGILCHTLVLQRQCEQNYVEKSLKYTLQCNYSRTYRKSRANSGIEPLFIITCIFLRLLDTDHRALAAAFAIFTNSMSSSLNCSLGVCK